MTYGPTALTVQFHPIRHGRIRPYVGAGISYMIVFDTEDGAFQNLEVENDLAPAFEAGVDFMITSRFGLFVDVKKALLRPTSTGTFNGMAVVGETPPRSLGIHRRRRLPLLVRWCRRKCRQRRDSLNRHPRESGDPASCSHLGSKQGGGLCFARLRLPLSRA